jgi:hypothetical protein
MTTGRHVTYRSGDLGLIDTLPRNQFGKVIKRDLRQALG